MSIHARRSFVRTLLAAGLAVAGTIGSFAATTAHAQGKSGYSATLATGLEAPARKVVNGVVWKCTGSNCAGPVDGARPLNTCVQVAKNFGEITRFATPKGEFSADELQRCNAAA